MPRFAAAAIVAGLLLLTALIFPLPAPSRADDASPPARQATISRQKLQPLNALIGDWRGVGQLKRGSRTGAWAEQMTCAWDFQSEQPAVVLTSRDGQQFDSLRFWWDAEKQHLVLEQRNGDDVCFYVGEMPKQWPDKVVMQSAADDTGTTRRCTIQQLQDIRATILLEKQTSPTGSFRRIAEVGYTRSGERLAIAGANQRKCIVTGGLGTIAVTYNGKTYYVCCQGCVQAFQDAPDAIIADYQAGLEAARKSP